MGDADAARKWIATTHEVYHNQDRTNHYALMLEGTALLRLGEEQEARDAFKRIYELYGKEGFKGEHAACLKLAR